MAMSVKKTMVAVAVATAVIGAFACPPANAADAFAVAVDKTTNLYRAGDQVTVTVSNTPSGEGVYLMYCETPAAGSRPTKCLGRGYWASSDPVMIAAHALDLSSPIAVVVESNFVTDSNQTVSCITTGCGLFVRRDHMDPTDKSLDTFIPLTFAPEYSVQLSKTSGLFRHEDTAEVLLPGLPKATGVYVRECAMSSNSDRPTLCDGQGVWATNDPQWLPFGATDASAEFAIKLHQTFVSNGQTIDCDVAKCGVFVRRDHLNPNDMTLDKFVPITFAKLRPTNARVSAASNSRTVIVSLSGNVGDAFSVTVNGFDQNAVLSATTQKLRVTVKKKSKVKVTVRFGGHDLLVKTLKL